MSRRRRLIIVIPILGIPIVLSAVNLLLGFQFLQATFDALSLLGIYQVPNEVYGVLAAVFAMLFAYLILRGQGEA